MIPGYQLPIRVVCATRLSESDFLTKTATGRSIASFANPSPVELRLFFSNQIGLSTVYNQAIEEAKQRPAILVFTHDDLIICDFLWTERIRHGLKYFGIVGLAGNKRRLPNQAAWCFLSPQLNFDDPAHLSGCVGHGKKFPPENISQFGPTHQECKLLDGLMLAMDSQMLEITGLRFDEQFKFHFYDMDFCRQAEMFKIKMGTIPLSVIHESEGHFISDEWNLAYRTYLTKWQS